MTLQFNYAEFTHRNIGFVTETEQSQLRSSRVLVCGVGGMGGACLQALARAGIGEFGIADFDVFELSNLNRQVFANLRTVGVSKTEATRAQLLEINPEIQLSVYGADWTERLDELLKHFPIVVNGMDDLAAGIELYRKARIHGATVIDAYTAPLPSVVVVRPGDPLPEERLLFPTVGVDWRAISTETKQIAAAREIEYVLVHSSSAQHIDLDIAKDLLTGKRKRMSFAPMVITTGNLMAFEVLKLLLRKPASADCRGYFFNPWKCRVEHPRSAALAPLLRFMVRRFIRRMTQEGGA